MLKLVNSKILKSEKQKIIVSAFIEEQFPKASLKPIYDAEIHGWEIDDFKRHCANKDMTLVLLETKENKIFGAFTSQFWEEYETNSWYKLDPKSFLFSVDF